MTKHCHPDQIRLAIIGFAALLSPAKAPYKQHDQIYTGDGEHQHGDEPLGYTDRLFRPVHTSIRTQRRSLIGTVRKISGISILILTAALLRIHSLSFISIPSLSGILPAVR